MQVKCAENEIDAIDRPNQHRRPGREALAIDKTALRHVVKMTANGAHEIDRRTGRGVVVRIKKSFGEGFDIGPGIDEDTGRENGPLTLVETIDH